MNQSMNQGVKQNARVRIAIFAAVGVALLLCTTAAFANDMSGTDAIRAKNTRTQTVQLGDRSFRLNDESVIRDAEGNRISLADLNVPDLGRGGVDPGLGGYLGQYVATQQGGKLILVTLKIKPLSD